MEKENPGFDPQGEQGLSHYKHGTKTTKESFVKLAIESPDKKQRKHNLDLLYSLDETPPWYLCIFLGFQQYLTMFGATIAIPLILANNLCIAEDSPAKAELIGTIFFVSGIVTLLQSTFGARLPIVQGGTFSYLVPTFAILSLPQWKCPAALPADNSTEMNTTAGADNPEVWHPRMREVQGAIIVASMFQVFIGATGIIGVFVQFIGPLTVAPTISLIALSLFKETASFCAGQWWIAIATMLLMIISSQYLRNIAIPCCCTNKQSQKRIRFSAFKLFPVILSMLVAWLLCYIFTVTNVFPNDPNAWGYQARTDIKINVLRQAQWFRFPYPFQWGLPTVSVSGVFGMLAGVLAGMMESIGDYYAAARLAGAPPPPIHAVNRGIMMEGVGCVLAGMWGTGSGTTSYSENIGAIGITKVGSRVVIQAGAVVMLLLGMLGKFGALFATIPNPVMGGIFMVMFGMVAAVGISNLQHVDLNSSRNLCIFGFSLFFGLTTPTWVKENFDSIQTGSVIANQILFVLASTSMFVGGIIGLILDNTIPGTAQERGIKNWQAELTSDTDDVTDRDALSTYDLPLCGRALNRQGWTRRVPFLPTFRTCGGCRGRRPSTPVHSPSGAQLVSSDPGVRQRQTDSHKVDVSQL